MQTFVVRKVSAAAHPDEGGLLRLHRRETRKLHDEYTVSRKNEEVKKNVRGLLKELEEEQEGHTLTV